MSRITQPAADVTATGCSGGAKSAKARAQFDTALQASVFDDQQAFLAALMDEQTLTQLEQLKQNLENQRRQAQTLVTQTTETLTQHQQHRRRVGSHCDGGADSARVSANSPKVA